MSIFITGTDTGVGKTYTAVCLLRLARASGLRCAGMKPICCGDRADAELLLEASSAGLTIDDINPVWLRTPAAPLPASETEQVSIDPQRLVDHLTRLQAQFDFVVVEGVGGWLVPISADYFISDLAVAMRLPVLVVALNRLGCLNHTMLTLRSVTASGLGCAGLVLNSPSSTEVDFAVATNREVLSRIGGVPMLPELNDSRTTIPPEWRQILASDAAVR